MAENASIQGALRDKIIAEPDVILGDRDLMRALVAANEKAMGANIIDLRGIAMERLESRLERLEDTHRSVIAAAYENLAGTNQIHRAILKLLEPATFEEFLHVVEAEIVGILRLTAVRLVLESQQETGPAVERLGQVVRVVPPGLIDAYVTAGRDQPVRQVTLRQVKPKSDLLYGDAAEWIRSEACMRLDLGPGRLAGMLLLGSEDPHQFKASMGTDLLGFFAGVFERTMRRWLA